MAPEEGIIHLIKLKAVEPQAYITSTRSLLVNGHIPEQPRG